MSIFVFDMDGTLTPARLPMELDFANQFLNWQKSHRNFLATGSDFFKVQEQLPDEVINGFSGLYTSMGNVLTSKGQVVYKKDFKANPKLFQRLEYFRANTKYPCLLYPNYIEERRGMINFSVLGRDCPYQAREQYAVWDKTAKERENIAKILREEFPEYEVAVGGSISMDITPQGCGKGQIAYHLRNRYPDDKIFFFGDKTFKGGNDYELAEALRALENTEVIQVDFPARVLQILEELG